MERRLAAVLVMDVVGYSRLMGEDEHGTLAALKRCRSVLIDPKVRQYNGRVVKLMGDGALMEFPSVVDAVRFAVEVQVASADPKSAIPPGIVWRIGINLGDVVADGDDIYGDGVNIAARLEPLAEPGGICVSEAVRSQISGKLDLGLVGMGRQSVKNIAEPIAIHSIALDDRARALVTPLDPIRPSPSFPVNAAVLSLAVAVAALLTWGVLHGFTGRDAVGETHALDLPDKPSVAVLAFSNLSGDPGQEYLSDAMSEAIINALSLSPDLFVIARQSSFSYKGSSVPVSQLARELGVRYILEGSVQRSSDQLRVTAQLVDALEGRQLWSQRYDRQWTDVFQLQDEITQHIVATLVSYEGPLETATRKSIAGKAPSDMRAYDYLLLGRERFFQVTKEHNAQARDYFAQAVRIDPEYSLGYAWLAWSHLVNVTFGWSSDPAGEAKLVLNYAEKSVALDPSSADAHWSLAAALSLDPSRSERALAEYERTVALNPNNADLWAQYGWTLPRLGRHAEAVDAVERAMRLNPVYPDWYVQALLFALYNAGQYERVVHVASDISVRHLQTHLVVAGSYAFLGRMPEARAAARAVLEIDPAFSISEWNAVQEFADPADARRFFEGLRLAGLPE